MSADRRRHRRILAALLLAAVLFDAVLIVTTARASTADPLVVTGPVRCHQVQCVQWRTVTTSRHGGVATTERDRRTRPVESRTFTHEGQPWTRWAFVSVAVTR